MADKIATEQEAYNVGGKGSPSANRCCTQIRAIELGCKDIGYDNNRLIPKNLLSKSSVSYQLLINNATNLSPKYYVDPGNIKGTEQECDLNITETLYFNGGTVDIKVSTNGKGSFRMRFSDNIEVVTITGTHNCTIDKVSNTILDVDFDDPDGTISAIIKFKILDYSETSVFQFTLLYN